MGVRCIKIIADIVLRGIGALDTALQMACGDAVITVEPCSQVIIQPLRVIVSTVLRVVVSMVITYIKRHRETSAQCHFAELVATRGLRGITAAQP